MMGKKNVSIKMDLCDGACLMALLLNLARAPTVKLVGLSFAKPQRSYDQTRHGHNALVTRKDTATVDSPLSAGCRDCFVSQKCTPYQKKGLDQF